MHDRKATGGGDEDSPLYRYRLGNVEFDEARFELRVNGLVVDLERKPLQVLTELLRHADHVVTRKQLLDSVWNGRPTVDHALGNTISKLRKALDDPSGQRIVTVPRTGFRCEGPVERVVVGRRTLSRLSLKPGQAVPGRDTFELVFQLGASFGNEVWLAKEPATRTRRVFKFNRQGEALGALKREASIHRLLQDSLGARPDWVRLLAWNFDNPPFYLEYEYGGENLDTWAVSDDRLKSLRLQARLDLFLQVADAVGTAHSLGVLHKDLKPTNILVAPRAAGDWQLRVTDFGSAQLLDPERLQELAISRLGATLGGTAEGAGTPFYLAPELIAGAQPTVMSDVYSLGILLYQLSIGDIRKPLTSDWQRDVPDELLREDIARATAGAPERRLSSVAELARRLRERDTRLRALMDGRAAAEQALATQRLLERTRARRPWVMALTLSLLAGFIVSFTLYQRESAAHRDAVRDNRRTQAINTFLDGVLRSADPSEPGGASKTPIESLLRRATDNLKLEFNDDPATKAAVTLSLARSFFGLSEYAIALPLNQQAVRLRQESLGPHDSATIEVQYHLAHTLDLLSRHTEAAQVLDVADRAAGTLLERNPRLAFLAYSTRGGNNLLQMQPAAALEQFQKTETIRQAIAPQDEEWLINVRSNIAWCDVRLGRDSEAVQALAPLITAHYTPQSVGVAEWIKLHLQYAVALTNLARFADADQTLEDTQHRAQELLGPAHYLVGLTWNYRAASYKAQGRWPEALDASQRAYDIWRSTVTDNNQSTLTAAADMAVVRYLAGQSANALIQLQAAHEAFAHQLGADSPFTQYVDFYLTNALLDAGRPADAALSSALLNAAALNATDPAPGWEARLRGLKGRLLFAQHRNAEAQELLQGAISTLSDQRAPPWMIAPLSVDLRASSHERLPATILQSVMAHDVPEASAGRGPRSSADDRGLSQ